MLSALHLRSGCDDASAAAPILYNKLAVPAHLAWTFSNKLSRENILRSSFLARGAGAFRESRRFSDAPAAAGRKNRIFNETPRRENDYAT